MWRLLFTALAVGCSAGPPDGMVPVSAASFVLGCAATAEGCEPDAMPAHRADLSDFAIDRLEVTQRRYRDCMAAGRCTQPRCSFSPGATPELPVVCVTFAQAAAYCAFIGGRLPTEAEWEAAARGHDARSYPWGEEPPDCVRAQYSGCGTPTDNGPTASATPSPVGTHTLGKSALGVEDLGGNAAEWVSDWYDDHYYAGAPTRDPTGPSQGKGRVLRGGSFRSSQSALRAYDRSAYPPEATDDYIGFRCAWR